MDQGSQGEAANQGQTSPDPPAAQGPGVPMKTGTGQERQGQGCSEVLKLILQKKSEALLGRVLRCVIVHTVLPLIRGAA
jgi:hypothetical protein